MPRYVFHPSPRGTHTDGQGNIGFLLTVADGAVVRSPHPILNSSAGYTLIQPPPLVESEAAKSERIRRLLLAFKDGLSASQRARLWWPHYDSVKRAIDDRDLAAVAIMVNSLPWAQNENALKAQVLALFN